MSNSSFRTMHLLGIIAFALGACQPPFVDIVINDPPPPGLSDTDFDGISDVDEIVYPRLCVAFDPTNQRRPSVGCMRDSDCVSGESCRGLHPLRPDSDGDGRSDIRETSNPSISDPRLFDTDGNGRSDYFDLSDCDSFRDEGDHLGIGDTLVTSGLFAESRPPVGTQGGSAVVLDSPVYRVAGLRFQRSPNGLDLAGNTAELKQIISNSLLSMPGLSIATQGDYPDVSNRNRTTVRSFFYRVTLSGAASSATAVRSVILQALFNADNSSPVSFAAGNDFLVEASNYVEGSNDLLLAVSPADRSAEVAELTQGFLTASGIKGFLEVAFPDCTEIAVTSFGRTFPVPQSYLPVAHTLIVLLNGQPLRPGLPDGFHLNVTTREVELGSSVQLLQPGDRILFAAIYNSGLIIE